VDEPTRLLGRYLDQLGVERDEPSGRLLTALHAAHAQRYAHDTVWIARGRLPRLDAVSMATALVTGEGGGCLQLNGGFAWLLARLGFQVELRQAMVQRAFERAPAGRPDAHIALVVTVEDSQWYADVGLGNGPLHPLPLAEGSYPQPPFTFAMEAPSGPDEGWRFLHDPSMLAVRSARLAPAASQLEDWAEVYRIDTTDPASDFVRVLSAIRRTTDGVSMMMGRSLITLSASGRKLRRITAQDEWVDIARGVFGLGLPGLTTDDLTRLWARTGS
jgi:arylamine N-acetyltransferase